MSKSIAVELSKNEIPVKIYKEGEVALVNQIKQVKCLYCGEDFFLNTKSMIKGKEITCSWCGKKHLNTSNVKFILKKIDENSLEKPKTKKSRTTK